MMNFFIACNSKINCMHLNAHVGGGCQVQPPPHIFRICIIYICAYRHISITCISPIHRSVYTCQDMLYCESNHFEVCLDILFYNDYVTLLLCNKLYSRLCNAYDMCTGTWYNEIPMLYHCIYIL